MLERQPHGLGTPYCNSKMAVALFTKKLGEILEGTGVRTFAVCCGLVDTNIFRNEPFLWKLIFQMFLRAFGFNVKEVFITLDSRLFARFGGYFVSYKISFNYLRCLHLKGCETVLHCALSRSLEEETGRLYRFLDRWDDAWEVLDDCTAQRLWDVSETLVGQKGFADKFRSRGCSLVNK